MTKVIRLVNWTCLQKPFNYIQKTIKNYFKYFAAGPIETRWGFHLSAIGHTRIRPNQPYPPQQHPQGRAFNWELGRVLPALQMVAIRRGHGEIEWTRERHPVQAGTVFLLRPGEWHRYRPKPATGWIEDWLELRGAQVDRWLESGALESRVYQLYAAKDFFKRMDRLHADSSSPTHWAPGCRAGQAMALLAEVVDSNALGAATKAGPGHRELVAAAREQLAAGKGVEAVAGSLGISYPTLNRIFKKLTGIGPKAYAHQLRLARAEALLVSEQLTVKEIAEELGYFSANHFSAAFKKAYGHSPSHWRKRSRG